MLVSAADLEQHRETMLDALAEARAKGSEEAAENSRMLEDIMVRNGFYGYWGEWWHYSDNDTYELIIP